MTEEYQYIRTEGDYYIYSQIPGSSWMVLEKIPSFYLENSYRSIRNITLAVIGVGIVLLGILYYLYSKNESSHTDIERSNGADSEREVGYSCADKF